MSVISNAFDFLSKGGPVMIPLLLCSVVSITVIIERYIRLKSETTHAPRLMEQLERSLALD
ncbi:MAG TPA: MotA/TolQ/ExbB proton channel family protein, partial [Armatimonadota bacterium]